jgi:phosphoribosylamine--glycine ligase
LLGNIFLQKVLDFSCGSRIPSLGNGRWDNGLKACGAAGLPEPRSRNLSPLGERGSNAGLMIDKKQQPKLLEFNCRLGDPETQPIMMRLKSDLFSLCNNAVDNKLHSSTLSWDCRPAVGVVLTTDGYPTNVQKGNLIETLPLVNIINSKIFHAGTTYKNGVLVTNGGRVLCVTSLGDNYKQAQKEAYQIASEVHWPGLYYRKDIADRVVKSEG